MLCMCVSCLVLKRVFVFPSIHPSTITSQHLYKCIQYILYLTALQHKPKKDSEYFLVSTQNLKSTTNASSPFSCASNADK